MAALVNGITLVAIAVLIVVAAIDGWEIPPRSTARACWSGRLGLAGNVAATWVLAAGQREDINLEGVLRHSAADALGSIGVVVAGASSWQPVGSRSTR